METLKRMFIRFYYFWVTLWYARQVINELYNSSPILYEERRRQEQFMMAGAVILLPLCWFAFEYSKYIGLI